MSSQHPVTEVASRAISTRFCARRKWIAGAVVVVTLAFIGGVLVRCDGHTDAESTDSGAPAFKIDVIGLSASIDPTGQLVLIAEVLVANDHSDVLVVSAADLRRLLFRSRIVELQDGIIRYDLSRWVPAAEPEPLESRPLLAAGLSESIHEVVWRLDPAEWSIEMGSDFSVHSEVRVDWDDSVRYRFRASDQILAVDIHGSNVIPFHFLGEASIAPDETRPRATP